MHKEFLEAGKIVSTFGIKGEVNVLSYCNSPEELAGLTHLYLYNGKSYSELEPEHSFVRKSGVVFKFHGIDTVEAAQKYREKMLYLRREDVELPEGSYFWQDLIGLTVKDYLTDTDYGTISEITFTGSHDVYHVKSPSGTVNMIPAVPEFIIETDIENGVCRIKTIDGLITGEIV
jgi:16S rRNA processing protein RimM